MSANSVRLSLPREIAPAACEAPHDGGVMCRDRIGKTAEPQVVRTPRVAQRSFMPIGTPCSGPRCAPRAISASAAAGCRQRALGHDGQIAVQFPVEALDAGEHRRA